MKWLSWSLTAAWCLASIAFVGWTPEVILTKTAEVLSPNTILRLLYLSGSASLLLSAISLHLLLKCIRLERKLSAKKTPEELGMIPFSPVKGVYLYRKQGRPDDEWYCRKCADNLGVSSIMNRAVKSGSDSYYACSSCGFTYRHEEEEESDGETCTMQ